VPHGSVETVWYHSNALNAARRMHVYLPPGYETGTQRFPVLYLLHVAGDNDDAWTSVRHTWVNWRNYLSDFAPLLFQ
jgi:enterochelin esterase family protein